uniref:Uncharacterized protein n=1 Tax=Sphaerodactylus townsendi TaxID=933632 RepID=A0ACB8G3U7_9SAUR
MHWGWDELCQEMRVLQRQMARLLVAPPTRVPAPVQPAAGQARAVPTRGDGVGLGAATSLQGPAPPALRLRKRRKEIKDTFDRGPQKLPYFLMQGGTYMRMLKDEHENDADRVNEIRTLLEGEATDSRPLQDE